MSGKVLGFLLDEATFYIHTSNVPEVARFGSDDLSTHVRIYSDSDSNSGFILQTSKASKGAPPSFSIQADHLAYPSFFVQGDTGRVGINTHRPNHALEVVGDFFLDGQIIQRGSNTILYSEVVQSGSLYADVIRSCNVLNTIDCTNSVFSNVQVLVANEEVRIGDTVVLSQVAGPALRVQQGDASRSVAQFSYLSSNVSLVVAAGGNVGVGTGTPLAPLHVQGGLRLEGEPFLHIMGGVQRLQATTRVPSVMVAGSYQIGFDMEWGNVATSEMDLLEITGTCFASGPSKKRMHFRFHALVDTTDNGTTLPGLDSIADQSSMTSEGFSPPKLRILRNGTRSIKVLVVWTSSQGGYQSTFKIDASGPTGLGTLRARPLTIP